MNQRRLPPCEPPEPADGRSCDCGGCNAESVGWRWFTDLLEWLPACERHLADGRVLDEFKRYDPPLPVEPKPEPIPPPPPLSSDPGDWKFRGYDQMGLPTWSWAPVEPKETK